MRRFSATGHLPDRLQITFSKMTIAVDFDGTIVRHRYPEIGPEIPFAIDTLKLLRSENHRLILWTVREGRLLDEAVEYCRRRGLDFYAVNSNYPEEKSSHAGYSRKICADLYIDDRNIGGIPDWGTIYNMIHGSGSASEAGTEHRDSGSCHKKLSFFFKRLK